MNNTRFKQRGAAALAVAMVLLFAMTAVAFFANRTMIFEQRTSANQVRYTKGFEVADAGIEWAIARLNDPSTLTAASCAPASGAGLVSFRDRYIQPTAANPLAVPPIPTGWFNPITTVFPGCQIDPSNGNLTCGCPAAGAATLATATQPRFRVRFMPVTVANNPTGDLQAVEIISRGCTNGDPCNPDPLQPATSSDSSSIVRVIVKLRPTFPTIPGAGLISGSVTVASGGSINVINTDPVSNGITINTGSTVDLTSNGFQVQSLPGTAPAQSILDNDPSLWKLTNADANGELFFSGFFGGGFDSYKSSLTTKVLTPVASNASYANGTCLIGGGNNVGTDCGKAVSYWVDRGINQFWVAGDVQFGTSNMPSNAITGGTLGTAAKPVAVVADGLLTFGGNVTAYGIFYANNALATDDPLGGGGAKIVGSFIARGGINKTGTGNLSVIYDSNLFGAAGPPTGILVPVPGSWRDKALPF